MGLVVDTAVVGGGLAGLASAALAARRGKRVCVFERARELGGRGASQVKAGFTWNLGGHALYRGSHAERVLADLGVAIKGAPPPVTGYALVGDRAHALPVGLFSLVTTRALGFQGKLETGGLLARLGKLDTDELAGTTLEEWLQVETQDPGARAIVEMFVRLTSYANAPGIVSAGAALEQLRLGQAKGVLYLDGGWQTLVDGLTANARDHGARIEVGALVRRVEPLDDGSFLLQQEGGLETQAREVILAVPPGVAATITSGPAKGVLEDWSHRCVPGRVSCLDVLLSSLPRPKARFALGASQPTYFSVHSTVCKLGPPEERGRFRPRSSRPSALIHLMKYLAPDDEGRTSEAELEATLDRTQPGWRELVVERRFLPKLVATNALVTASERGLGGRPGPRVPGHPGLVVAGDWVGQEGMLADASLASAWAADLALTDDGPARALSFPRTPRSPEMDLRAGT
jgi:phytoene dehydrogenase-like protein